jgi:hypothetical protein
MSSPRSDDRAEALTHSYRRPSLYCTSAIFYCGCSPLARCPADDDREKLKRCPHRAIAKSQMPDPRSGGCAKGGVPASSRKKEIDSAIAVKGAGLTDKAMRKSNVLDPLIRAAAEAAFDFYDSRAQLGGRSQNP